jgi:hypothetical protein
MALIYHATLEDLLPTVGDSELVAGNGAVVNENHLSLPNYNSGVYPETPIALGSTYTISMWFKDLKDRNSAQGGWMMMAATSDGGGSNGNHGGSVGGYTMSIYTAGELGAWDTAWRGSGYAMTQAAFTGTDWHHIVASFDNGTLTYYIDGAQVGSPVAYAGSSSIEIFGSWLNYNYGFADYIDDIQVYDNALSASDASTLFAGGRMQLTDGLVAKYALDTDATDSVGSNDGTNANVTFADGAAQFNGSNARFTLASEPFTASDSDYTISVWAKHDNVSSTQRLLGWGDTNGRYFVGYHTGLDKIYIGMGDIDIVPTVAYKPTAGQVEHWVFSNSGNTTKFYKDGVLIDTVVHSATGAISAGAGMRIGSVYAEYGEYLDGSMDDLRIWDRQLSDAEVTTLHAAGAEAYVPPAGTITLTIKQVDSYGDSWNGGSLSISDSGGNVLGTFAGPPNGAGAGGFIEETLDVPDDAQYTWSAVAGSYPGEISFIISDSNGELINIPNLQAHGSLTGTFDIGTPSVPPTIDATIDSYASELITISTSLNAPGLAQAANWSYRTDVDFVVGNPHGGTLVAIGATGAVSVTAGPNTVYVAAVDSNGDVLAISPSVSINTSMVTLELQKTDSYGDGWNGAVFNILDSNGVEVASETIEAGFGSTVSILLADDSYTWALSAGSYPGEVSMTLTNTATAEVLITIATGDAKPASGSFVLGPVAPSITPTASSAGEVITVSSSINAEATSAGAANWSASLTPFGEVGAAISGSATLTGLGADAGLVASTGGNTVIYAVVVDAAGIILASSTTSVDVRITTWSVGDELVLWVMLDPTDADSIGDYTHPMQHPSFGSGKEFGPFYVGDLEIKTLGASTLPSSELITPVTFNDGSGGTLDMKDVIKNVIKKYKLNEMSGIHATYGAAFQLAVDANTLGDVLLNSMDEVSMNVSRKLAGGGYTIDSYTKIVEESGALVLQESSEPVSTTTGDGGQFTGIYSIGEDPNAFYNSLDALYGLTAHYPFENDVNTAEGVANGTLMGGASTNGTALILDGSDDYVRISHDTSNNFGGVNDPFSVSMWFKSSADGPLLYKGRQSSASDFWGIYLNADGTVSMNGWDQGPDQSYSYATQGNTYLDNEWHHLLVTHDDDGMIYLYIDGDMQFGGDGWVANHGNTDYLTVGAYFNYSWSSAYFAGEIRDMRLWDTDLIPLQALYLYEEGLPASLNVSVSANGEVVTITTSATPAALAAGATHWAYSTSPLGAVGQPHGGTLLPVETLSDAFTPSVGYHTIYCAAVDASGNVLFTETATIDTTPISYFKWKWYTTDWSGLNGGRMTLTDSLGTETLSPVVSYDTNNVWGESDIFTLPQGQYTWSVNEHSIRASDQGHLKLVEVNAAGSELREVVYVWATQTRMFLDGTAWPNQVYAGQFDAPEIAESLTIPVWEAGKTYQWANWQSEQNVTDYGGYVDFSLNVEMDDPPFAPDGLPSAGAITLVVDGVEADGTLFANKVLIYTYTGLGSPGSLYDGAALQSIDGIAPDSIEENFWRIHQLSNYDFYDSDNVTDNVIMSLMPNFPNIASPNSDRPIPGLLQPGSNLIIKELLITSAGVDYDVLENINYSSSLTDQAVDVVSHALSLSGVTMAAGFAQGDIEIYNDSDQLIATYEDTSTAGEAIACAVDLSQGTYYLKLKDNGNDGMFTLENNLATVVFQVENLATGVSAQKSIIPTVAEFLANPETHDGTSDDSAHSRLYFEIGADLSATIPYTQGDTVYYTNASLTPNGWTGQIYDDSTESNIVESWYTWPTGGGYPEAGVGTLIDNGQGGGNNNNNNNNNNNQGGENNMARIIKNRVDLRTQMDDGADVGQFGSVGAEFLKGDGRAMVSFVPDQDHQIINKGFIKGSYDALIADVAAEEASYDAQKLTDDNTEIAEELAVNTEITTLSDLMAEGVSWKSPEQTVSDALTRAIADRDAGNPWLDGSVVAIHDDASVMIVLKQNDLTAQACVNNAAVWPSQAEIDTGVFTAEEVIPYLVAIASFAPDRLLDMSALEQAVDNLMDVSSQYVNVMGLIDDGLSIQDHIDAARTHALAAFVTAEGQSQQMATASKNVIEALLLEDKSSAVDFMGTYDSASIFTALVVPGARRLIDVEVYVSGVRSFDQFTLDSVAGTITIPAGVHEDGASIQIFGRMELETERANPLGA